VKEAVEFCNNALLLDGRYIPAIVSRAHLFVAEGENEAARVSFEKLLLFDDPMLASVAYEGVAYIDFLAGRFDDATDGMDEAIRQAMSIGSMQRGLLHAFRLVDYLCELGRVDAAEAVLDRWVSRHGEIPDRLGRLRIGITRGDVVEARRALARIEDNDLWRTWMRALALDVVDFQALTFIKENNFGKALEVLNASSTGSVVGTRRAYLKGFALFQNGNAEQAVDFFQEARLRFHSLVFPYHSDPILYVQAIFFLAEAAIARGDGEEAARYYRDFLDLWGEAHWDLQAVGRAQKKLETLTPNPSDG
jgi:tetratricopeptide (TPR) repeat protein